MTAAIHAALQAQAGRTARAMIKARARAYARNPRHLDAIATRISGKLSGLPPDKSLAVTFPPVTFFNSVEKIQAQIGLAGQHSTHRGLIHAKELREVLLSEPFKGKVFFKPHGRFMPKWHMFVKHYITKIS